MTVPPPTQPSPPPTRTSPPRYRVLDDVWEGPPSNKPRRLRAVVGAASIGVALIGACVAILQSGSRTDPNDPSTWARPAPPPYAIARDTTPLLSPVELPPPQAALESPPARSVRSAPPADVPAPLPPPPPAPRRQPAPRVVSVPGYLSINSNPWAVLSVDGRIVGSTPQVRVRVTPGRHRLLLLREGFKKYEGWADVGAGATVRITNITLEKDAQ